MWRGGIARCATRSPKSSRLRENRRTFRVGSSLSPGTGVVRLCAARRLLTPAGLPIYDQSKAYPGAFVFTCHSGVTLAANHALEVSRWVSEGEIPREMSCFATDRFDVPQAA